MGQLVAVRPLGERLDDYLDRLISGANFVTEDLMPVIFPIISLS